MFAFCHGRRLCLIWLCVSACSLFRHFHFLWFLSLLIVCVFGVSVFVVFVALSLLALRAYVSALSLLSGCTLFVGVVRCVFVVI